MSKSISHNWLSKNILNIDYCDLSSANSLTPGILFEVLKIIKHNKPKAMLFSSSHPRVYCSGGNLKNYASMTESQSRELNQKMRDLLNEFSQLETYTVAYIDGDCFGGGLEFLAAFDELHATPYCLFGFWQKKQALSFGWGGYKRLLKRISQKSLIGYLQNAETLISTQALNCGLIDSVEVDLNRVLKAIETCTKTENYQQIKKLNSIDETDIFEKLWFSTDHRRKLEKIKSSTPDS